MKLPNGVIISRGGRIFKKEIPDNLVSESSKKLISDFENRKNKKVSKVERKNIEVKEEK